MFLEQQGEIGTHQGRPWGEPDCTGGCGGEVGLCSEPAALGALWVGAWPGRCPPPPPPPACGIGSAVSFKKKLKGKKITGAGEAGGKIYKKKYNKN